MKTIKQVAKLCETSVRTLQYYDEIHLLEPSEKTEAGYRLYSEQDIQKLREILFLKELGLQLKEIQAIVENPQKDQRKLFMNHKNLLRAKQEQAEKVIRILERLEDGESLEDCAEEIQKLSEKTKHLQKKGLFTGLIVLIMLAVGTFGAYQTLRVIQPKNPDEENVVKEEVADIIRTNPVEADGADNCYAISSLKIDAADLPQNVPNLEQLGLPEDSKNNLEIRALYQYKREGDPEAFINYEVTAAGSNNRYAMIGFAADRQPIREMYAPKGEPSIISGQEVMIGYYVGQFYDENTDSLQPADRYYVDFRAHDLNFSVETFGLNETELVNLIKSLL